MLGIIIANWNGEKILNMCLLSLKNQTYKDFKVYVVDNGSKDNSIKIIENLSRYINISLIKLDKNLGFAYANNIGISKAIKDKCKYILTLNNDVELEKDALLNSVKVIKDNKYDIFQFLMVNYFDREKCDAAGLIFKKNLIVEQVGHKHNLQEVLNYNRELDGACAGAAIYSAKCLEGVKLENDNYFDANYFAYYEDVDLALRLKKAGYLTCLLKNSIAFHIHSATSNKSNGFKEYYLSRNLFLYTRKNQSEVEYNNNIKYYKYIILKSLIKNILKLNVVKNIAKGYKDGVNHSINTK
ncbi:glycosyltransferase family 2 protein [Clostridium intestinale]|uniref:Glycosyltransferase family 2 protein n=1 Tax=Clostridium intestinale TaxID=36845 RepID=A0A7D6VNH6_9CLOT|nr:glycosyltransferase family 2 protein [Clostridium intestinale]QLY79136.1 glycosyltransferase family 2 protein [Clostridium intestinale]